MVNFSDINKETSKDAMISKIIASSGLPKAEAINLYENFSRDCYGDVDKINESFLDFIKPNVTFDAESFKEFVLGMVEQINNASFDYEKRQLLSDELMRGIQNFSGISVDTPTLIEVICYVLSCKNPQSYQKLQSKISFGGRFQNINESVSFIPTTFDAESSVKLYEGLIDILGKNNDRWGYNYHLSNTYEAIVDYIRNEIEELTNQNNIVTVSDSFHLTLINELLQQEQMNPIYRNVNSLRELCPDLQTLIFDFTLLTNQYFTENIDIIQYIDRHIYIGYVDASKNLLASISSSLPASKVVCDKAKLEVGAERKFERRIADFKLNVDFPLDIEKLSLSTYPLNMNICLNMVHMTKACSGEFNLKLRQTINTYVTKTLELLIRTEKMINQKHVVNKFKNNTY